MTAITLIAAMDRNRAIGRRNALPWHLPEDLKRFKALTMGKPLLMGRKTAESLGRALPGRLNLVMTRSSAVPFPEMLPVRSLDDALVQVADSDELMVIGGGEIYALALPQASQLHLTHVDIAVDDADAWFPPFNVDQWRVQSDLQEVSKSGLGFRFIDYQRR